ncbi:MAG: hypothetical protein F083_2652 [bacterium F083]|nr:MAG: hypothetical protein F083_2652 [bacterium F083]
MTERKKELLALLPIEVKQSKELTTNAKLILGNIIQLYGTDYARENKSCYRTNKQMMSDTQIRSENTIISCSIQLEQKGLITRVSGKRGEASTYILNVDVLNNYTSISDCSHGGNANEIALLKASVSEIKSEIDNLRSTFEELMAAISSITSKANCSTDIDTDIEEELYVDSTSAVETKPSLKQSEVMDDIPFDVDEDEAETTSEVKETESDKPICANSKNSEDMSYTEEELRAVNHQAIEEFKMMDETRHQHGGNQYTEVNEWVGKKLSRGYDLLGTFRQTKKEDAANAYAHEINELIGSMNKAIISGAITQKQSEAFGKFIDSTNKAYDDKVIYFNRGEQMKKPNPKTVLETEKTANQQKRKEIEKAAPHPTALTDADIQRMAKEANDLFAVWDIQKLTELNEENTKTIKANGTPQQMNLYKRLTA